MADGVVVTKTPIADYKAACLVDVVSYDLESRRVVGKLKEVFINKRLNPDQRFFVYECSRAKTEASVPPPVPPTITPDGVKISTQAAVAQAEEEYILSDKNVALKKDCVKLAIMRQTEPAIEGRWVELVIFEQPFAEPKPGKTSLFVTTEMEFWPIELSKKNLETIKQQSL